MRLPFFRHKKISGKIASNRLKQMLLADRMKCPAELSQSIYQDMISVLSKYDEIDRTQLEVYVHQKKVNEKEVIPVMVIYAPVKKV